jgi:hypothetical protein
LLHVVILTPAEHQEDGMHEVVGGAHYTPHEVGRYLGLVLCSESFVFSFTSNHTIRAILYTLCSVVDDEATSTDLWSSHLGVLPVSLHDLLVEDLISARSEL